MRNILAALTAALLCCLAAEAADPKICIWSERWDVKILADKDAARIDFRPEKTSVHELINRKPKIPPILFMPRKGPEFKTFEVTARIKDYNTVIDGDLNLTLVDPKFPEETMIAEVPDPRCKDVKKTHYTNEFSRVWDEFRANCVKDGRIIADLKSHPAKEGLYTITGVGFLDMPHLQEGAAPNYIELHPILSIKKANLLLYW